MPRDPERKANELTKGKRSLERMLDVIGPYLPERDVPPSPAPSDWQLTQDSGCWPVPKNRQSKSR